MSEVKLPEHIIDKMKNLGIDVALSLQILDNYNAGKYDHIVPVRVTKIPDVDGKRIIDINGINSITFEYKEVRNRLDRLGISLDLRTIGIPEGDRIIFDRSALIRLGVLLYPFLSYGVLNGGSASSYIDYKKNKSFNETLFNIYQREFESIAAVSKGKPKGITPAFINENGRPGPTFMELKMRSLLIEIMRYVALTGSEYNLKYPMFQMTSVYNNDEIAAAYSGYKHSRFLEDLIRQTGVDITEVKTGVQPMLSAFTHSSEGRPKRLFLKAYGKDDSPLPMPGGHGQNFTYLKKVYNGLYKAGKRFVYLGNVDNLGFTVNPICVGLLALNGSEAAFEFSFKTKVDVKGGVLIIDQEGRLNCADIGAAISKDEIEKVEREGKRVLFNAATGLFDLEYLVNNLDYISENLPMRFSDQDKDAGRYSQAEQVTWEVIAMLEKKLIFGVDKYTRVLAAKLLLEGLMTSGIALDHPDFPQEIKPIAEKLASGLKRHLETTYGMRKEGMEWVPENPSDILARLNEDPINNYLNV